MATWDNQMTAPAANYPLALRPLRADARRNHARLLDAAREAFSEHGADANLDDIARRAGVGIGTLYRHFPARLDLLAAVLRDDMAALCADAERLLDDPSPAAALETWLRAVVAHAVSSRGLAAELMCTPPGDNSRSRSGCNAMQAAGGKLLARAQAAGEVRQDIDAADLFALVNGIAWATEHSPRECSQPDRLLSLMLDGLRG